MLISKKKELLLNLYKNIDNSINKLKEKTNLSCVENCGYCCKRCEPYMSLLEAIPIAEKILSDPKHLEFYNLNKKKSVCYFYNDNEKLHCYIYDIRPLICRLFGFSSKKTKEQIEFCTCSLILKNSPEKVNLAKKIIAELDDLIIKNAFKKIYEIDPFLATDIHPIHKSIDILIENYESILKNNYKKLNKKEEKNSFSSFLRGKNFSL